MTPTLAYKLLRGQIYESVNQVSMGWMLSAVGTALETYGLVADAAINRQAENTQIQGIYNSEKANAKAGLDAGKLFSETSFACPLPQPGWENSSLSDSIFGRLKGE